MNLEVFAEKIGMSQVFAEDGECKPVTLLKVKDCTIIDHKNKEKHNYNAVVVAFDEGVKEQKLNKPQVAYFKKHNLPLFKHIKEIRTDEVLEVGSKLAATDVLSGISYVDVTAISKGKGFAGVMKRHGFSGLRASHGVSISHRSHGSTGNMRKQGKVFKGKKMAGHMGNTQVTVQNLKLVRMDNNLLLIEGAVPGSVGVLVKIKPSIKKIKANSAKQSEGK